MSLKDYATHNLMKELQPSEMLAIYLMASGAEMSENVTKLNLMSVISLLCKKLKDYKANGTISSTETKPRVTSELPNGLTEDNLEQFLAQMSDFLSKSGLTKMIHVLCEKGR